MTWTFTFTGRSYYQLMAGQAVLLVTMLLAATLLTQLTMTWSRHVSQIEAALNAYDVADLPVLPVTRERELDRIVLALNEAGRRLSVARQRGDALARQMATAERLAAIGRVAAGMAHEIRNPIAAMRLKAESAVAGGPARQSQALHVILGEIERLDALVQRLLSITEHDVPKRERIEVSAFLATCVAQHTERAAAQGVTITFTADALQACFDPDQVQRGLDNLILNAINAAPADSLIEVTATHRPDALVLSVHDQGLGPPADIQKHPVRAIRYGTAGRNRVRLVDRARSCRSARRHGPLSGNRQRHHFRNYPAMAHILIVDDDATMRDALAEVVTDLGHTACLAANGLRALELLETEAVSAVFLDLRMPGIDGLEVLRRMRERGSASGGGNGDGNGGGGASTPAVTVLTAHATASNTIEAMRLGAFDHLTKPIGRNDLAQVLQRMLASVEKSSAQVIGAEADSLIGSSEAMRTVQKVIGVLADSDATVLITGETGTGKEVVARAIHEHGQRSRGPFVAMNCAAIPPDLLESELFGHTRGAFTGANADREGAFRQAESGTLFLDEIGDMDIAMQAKILRTLQERVVVPVGGKPVAVNVRVIAATHRDLIRGVADGTFREDLFYRLHVVPIHLPPLSERIADIVPLAEYFLNRAKASKRLSADAAAHLIRYGWPGNVRELKNAMERVAVMVRGEYIHATDLTFLEAVPLRQNSALDWPDEDLPSAIARLEEMLIRRALKHSGNNRTDAARRLNVNRQLLYTKLRRYGIETNDEAQGE